MALRRRRQHSVPDHSDSQSPSNVDQLAFRYMEMCKVESSTDSDSEISPRWSDTSTMGCGSSAPDSGSLRRTLPLVHKPAGRHGCYSLFLDPYDGSSEDSDELDADAGLPSRRARQQGKGGGGGCRLSRRSRRFILHQPPSFALREVVEDVQMKCGSDSELWVCELVSVPSHTHADAREDPAEATANGSAAQPQVVDIKLHGRPDDSCLRATRSPGPCSLRFLHKRKLGFPGLDVTELGQRKRQCVVHMEDEP